MPAYNVRGTPGLDTMVVYLTRVAGQPDNYRAEDSTGRLLESRNCTPAESTQITELANGDTLRVQVRDSLTVLRASVDTLQTLIDKPNNQITAADHKQAWREERRIARQLIAVSRLLVGALESADTGTA